MDGDDGDKERFGPVLRLARAGGDPAGAGRGHRSPPGLLGRRRAAARRHASDRRTPRLPRSGEPADHHLGRHHDHQHHAAAGDDHHLRRPPPRRPRRVARSGWPPTSGAVELALIGRARRPLRADAVGLLRRGGHRLALPGDQYRRRVPLGGVRLPGDLRARSCDARRLDVGESTDCWAETTALAGSNDRRGLGDRLDRRTDGHGPALTPGRRRRRLTRRRHLRGGAEIRHRLPVIRASGHRPRWPPAEAT